MIRINSTAEERQVIPYERFHYPDPRIQVKMEVLWLKSRGLDHATIRVLTQVDQMKCRGRFLGIFSA